MTEAHPSGNPGGVWPQGSYLWVLPQVHAPRSEKRKKLKKGEKILVLKWLTEENELDGSGALRNDRGFFCVVAHLPLPMSCVAQYRTECGKAPTWPTSISKLRLFSGSAFASHQQREAILGLLQGSSDRDSLRGIGRWCPLRPAWVTDKE